MSKSIPVAVRFDNELNSFLTRVVQEKNTTKTDFIRQAVVEKLKICMILKWLIRHFRNGLKVERKLIVMKK